MKTTKLLAAVVVFLLLAAPMGARAQDLRDPSDYIVILGVDPASSCSSIRLNILRNRETVYVGSTLVVVDGVVVTDHIGIGTGDDGLVVQGIGYSNIRGLAPVNLWPLAPGKRVDVILTLWNEDMQPAYEARASLASCNALALLESMHGPAYVLTRNHSFEGAGISAAGLEDPALAAFWKAKNASNDLRTCDGTANVRDACGLKISADPLVKSKFVNKVDVQIGPVRGAILNYYAKTQPGYSGGAKVIGKLYLANGTVVKLSSDVLISLAPNNWWLYYTWADLNAPVISAKTMIKQGYGTGVVSIDVVTLTVFTYDSAVPREAPPPVE
jgi:hypothetical protein